MLRQPRNGRIRVLALMPYPQNRAPGQRFRIEQWAPLLRAEGVDVVFSSFISTSALDIWYQHGHARRKIAETLKGYVNRFSYLLRPLPADVVFIYREAAFLGPALIERLLSWRVPVVFDFDDAIYLPDTSAANAWSRVLKSKGKTRAICRLARHVTVGNDVLADFARRHARAVTVVPTTIDTDTYPMLPRPDNRRPVIGWTGSVTTLPYLAQLAPVFERLRRSHDFEVRVVGGHVDFEGVSSQCVPWRAETEVADLSTFDIGLMPLRDDEWSRGKCAAKALQYMALGIPPVVSPVGVNADVVHDDVNGLHARTEDEWVDRIGRLLDDDKLRRRLGEAARRTVEEHYSARVHAPRMAQAFRDAVNG